MMIMNNAVLIAKSDVSIARVLAANARDARLTNHFDVYNRPTYAYARFVGRACDVKARILGNAARQNFIASLA
jgi:hypothetical protein